MKAIFFGQYLLNNGFIDPMQLAEAVELQEKNHKKLGDFLQVKNLLTDDQVKEILSLQRVKDIYFGQAAIQLGYVQQEHIDQALREQREQHIYIGEALVRLGYLPEDIKNKALSSYKEEQKNFNKIKGIDIYPRELEIEAPFIEQFIRLTMRMLKRMCGLKVKIYDCHLKMGEIKLEPLSIRLGFIGDFNHSLSDYLIMTSNELGIKMANHMLANYMLSSQELEMEDGMLEDVVAEIVNLICGNACNELFSADTKNIKLTLPKKNLYREGVTAYHLESHEKAAIVRFITPLGYISFALIFRDTK